MRRLIAIVCALLLAVSIVGPAVAGDAVLNLEQQLQCPTCDTPLNVSDAPSAMRIKAYIQDKYDAGWSISRIENSLVAQFGREILATPPKSGFDLIVWVVPGLLIIAGLVALAVISVAWSRRSRHSTPAAVGATPDELSRLNDELRRIKD